MCQEQTFLGTGLILSETQFPCRTLVARLTPTQFYQPPPGEGRRGEGGGAGNAGGACPHLPAVSLQPPSVGPWRALTRCVARAAVGISRHEPYFWELLPVSSPGLEPATQSHAL